MFIWIVVPTFVTTMGSLVTTDIIQGTCVPWGAYTSQASQKAVTSILLTVTYLVPLTVTVFCYSRIVYALLRREVSSGTEIHWNNSSVIAEGPRDALCQH